MFKLAYKDLRSDAFRQAVDKVAACGLYPAKTSYNLGRTTKKIADAFWKSQQEFIALAKPFYVIDEKGFIVKTDDGKPTLKEGVNESDVNTAIKAFNDTEVEIDRFKIKVTDLEPAKLTPQDFAILDPLLDAEE